MLIPLVDDYLQFYVKQRIRWLRDHLSIIDHIFHASKRETVDKLKDFISQSAIRVMIGYPREPTQIPAYVIVLQGESELPAGMGDDPGVLEDVYTADTDSDVEAVAIAKMHEYLSSTYMQSQYRIECWSDNGDLTAMMYVLLKWAIWSSKMDLERLGWMQLLLSGTDLEPVPDYMPMFIYRRSLLVSMTYDNLFHEELDHVAVIASVVEHPELYHLDDDGNVLDSEDNIVILCAEALRLLVTYKSDKGDYTFAWPES